MFRSALFLFMVSTLPAWSMTWSSAETISQAGVCDVPQISLDESGDAAVVWHQNDSGAHSVQTVTLPSGGSWSVAQRVSSDGQNSYAPQVGTDELGNSVVVWYRDDGGNNVVQASYVALSGVPTTPIDLSPDGYSTGLPAVASSQAGNCLAIWRRNDGVAQAVRGYHLGAWMMPETIRSSSSVVGDPQVVIHNGLGVGSWIYSDGSNDRVQIAIYHRERAWGAPTTLSAAGQDAANVQVKLQQNNDFRGVPSGVVVWQRSNRATTIIQASTIEDVHNYSTPVNLSAVGQNAVDPQVAVDKEGNAVAVWARSNGSNTIIQASTYSETTDSWSSAVDLSGVEQNATKPQIVVDDNQNNVAVWTRSDGPNTIVQAATLPFGGSWSAPVNLSQAGQNSVDPQIDVSDAGDAVVVWSRGGSIQAAVGSA